MWLMATSILPPRASPTRIVVMVCAAAMMSLAIAMGVGRFAFTPFFPLMVRDGLLGNGAGALIAASNYLGYLVGALFAARIRVKTTTLIALGLIGTVIVTAAVGWTHSLAAWIVLRFVAGVMSAWTLIATSTWGLGWLASLGHPQLTGIIFAGVGLGIATVGIFCLIAAGPLASSLRLWIELGALAGVAALFPLLATRILPVPAASTGEKASQGEALKPSAKTGGLVVCYTLFGFGYILPATYVPALARQLVDDPQIFGLAWPLFGMAAALSTVVVAWGLKRINRLSVWAVSHVLMALGVLLPGIWSSLVSISVAALLVGGTFMVITMLAMQEARTRVEGDATAVLGRMTAGFAFGQLMGPVISSVVGRFTPDFSTALNFALDLSALSLLLSAFYLWRVGRHPAY